jgi:hypothetical protein
LQHIEMLRRTELHFGNGRTVRNLFGEMKMLLARRVMGRPSAAASEIIDRQTLATFTTEDVPDLGLSETLFNIVPWENDTPRTGYPQDAVNNQPARKG